MALFGATPESVTSPRGVIDLSDLPYLERVVTNKAGYCVLFTAQRQATAGGIKEMVGTGDARQISSRSTIFRAVELVLTLNSAMFRQYDSEVQNSMSE